MTSALRAAFLRLLTEDSETNDRRRKEYNQAVFIPEDGSSFSGHAVWSETTLDMVMEKFDRALRECRPTLDTVFDQGRIK